MAIPQAKNNGKNQPSSSARFRQRKISVKQPLAIYKQKDLSVSDLASELEPSQVHHLNNNGQQQRDLHSFETGVDKNEEDEVHLQQVINAAQQALMSAKEDGDTKSHKKPDDKSNAVYIPTPDASRLWPDAAKYYNDNTYIEPDGYIKYSASVEDTVGVEYNLDEVDEVFINKELKNYPIVKKKSDKTKEEDLAKCTELEFELVCEKLERAIEEKQPFLSMDPENILSYKELASHILEEFNNSHKNLPYVQIGASLKYLSTSTLKEKLSKELKYEPFVTLYDKNSQNSTNNPPRSIAKLLELFGEPIYKHWKKRKLERKGKPIVATLKFEDPNANEKDNDNDPYICFRRREFRQARKTRRADTIGAEKIRLLQKSLHRARDIILAAGQREILKLESWRSEHKIFKLRCEAKAAKRLAGIEGDDHLFYPHKRRKLLRLKDDDDEREASRIRKEKRYKNDSREMVPGNRERAAAIQTTNPDGTTSTQPYVKLTPSKIPDMELVTASLVLKEKNETIKRAVLEKIRKRKEQDKGAINLTDDPYQPYFNISTNSLGKDSELKHVPYSSIAASALHQMNTTNYINEQLKKVLEDGKHPLPGTKTFRGSSGELIPSEPFPFIQSLLEDHADSKKSSGVGYISQLLANIEANDYSSYSSGFINNPQLQSKVESRISDPILRLRRRAGRGGRTFIDRRLIANKKDISDEFLKMPSSDEEDEVEEENKSNRSRKRPNVYDSNLDRLKRFKSNWRYDPEAQEFDTAVSKPFSLDPSSLNSISDDTQSIRFGSMLLSKSYDLLRDAVHQRQQAYLQQARVRALQQQQQQQLRNAANGRPNLPANTSSIKSSPSSASPTSSTNIHSSGSTPKQSMAASMTPSRMQPRAEKSSDSMPKNKPLVSSALSNMAPPAKLNSAASS